MSVLDMFRLDGKTALVTGGGKGLGLVMARALAEAGANVALAGRNLNVCQESCAKISEATGRKTLAIQADVTQSVDVSFMVETVDRDLGPIDILINNAGVNLRGLSHELDEETWDIVIDTNLKAPFLVSRLVGPRMCERGWGRIINLGSILSVVAIAGRAPYCSAKAGVANLTRVLALEWADKGVTVNALCPGPFATELNKPILEDPEKYKAFVAKIPMARWGELHEVAGPALFLASEAASFITGTTLFVDGGWTAQ